MNDERLSQALPFLRLRLEEPAWYFQVLFYLLCAGVAALVALYILRRRRQRQRVETSFRALAAEKGLDAAQTDFLLHLTRQNHLRNPLPLLTSVYVFDRCAGGRAALLAAKDTGATELETIADIRALLGFDRLSPDQPMRSTRQLEAGQTLMVWREADEEEAFFPWVVVRRDESGLVLVPLFREDFPRFASLAAGDRLTARLWREGDAEYRLEVRVKRVDAQTSEVSTGHADPVERLEQRDFYRLDTHFDIVFYALPAEEEPVRKSPEEELQGGGEGGEEEKEGEEELELDLDLTPTLRIEGQVLDLSAGGLGVRTSYLVPPDHLLYIDPAFEGPFPLAALLCEVVQATPSGQDTLLQLRFVDMSPARERQLVKQVYHHQIRASQPPEAAPTEDLEQS